MVFIIVRLTRLITGVVTSYARLAPLVEQELFTILEHLVHPGLLVGFVLLDLEFYGYVL